MVLAPGIGMGTGTDVGLCVVDVVFDFGDVLIDPGSIVLGELIGFDFGVRTLIR